MLKEIYNLNHILSGKTPLNPGDIFISSSIKGPFFLFRYTPEQFQPGDKAYKNFTLLATGTRSTIEAAAANHHKQGGRS